MIIIDKKEPDFVFKEFKKMGIPYKKKVLKCGDFTNEKRTFVVERKRSDDFYNSMVDGRLYDQLRKMDSLYESQKYILLEGYDAPKYFHDSEDIFADFDRENRKLCEKSPIQQVIEQHPLKQSWIFSQIKLAAEFNVCFLQTWNLLETVLFIEQLNEGAGKEPRLRRTKKRNKKFSLEENILMMFPQVGEKRCKKFISEFGSLAHIITLLRKGGHKKLEKYKLFEKMKDVFVE